MVIAQTIRELKGQSCIDLEDPSIPSKNPFLPQLDSALSEKSIVKQAVTFHVKRAHKRLTAQQQLCACMQVTPYEKTSLPPYKKSASHVLWFWNLKQMIY